MINICFVCLGNICRSPFAEALARKEIKDRDWQKKIFIDSSGTSNEHEGEASHTLSRRVGQEMGLEMNHKARPFSPDEFDQWDYILAMDRSNERWLKSHAPDQPSQDKISLLLSWDPNGSRVDVPDPWGYGLEAYYEMRDLIITALDNFFIHLKKNHSL